MTKLRGVDRPRDHVINERMHIDVVDCGRYIVVENHAVIDQLLADCASLALYRWHQLLSGKLRLDHVRQDFV
ncbi:hypothetical protein D3C81_1913270 [compost metagenome]